MGNGTRLDVSIGSSEAELVIDALREHVGTLRNAKRRPRGVSIGELADRIQAIDGHVVALTDALVVNRGHG